MSKAKSFLKKTLKAILWVAVIIVTIFILVAAMIRIPAIQNRIVRFATSFISDKTNTRVDINNVCISFPKIVVIEGLFLEDLQKDTLLYAGKAKINIALYDLFSSRISVSSVALEDVNLKLGRTGTDSLFNFNFLLAAFSDTTNQTKVKPQSPSKWTFSIDKVILKNIRFHYNDVYGGVNVVAALGNLKLKMDDIDFVKSIYGADELLIENLTANVRINIAANANGKKSDGVLPKITANKIRINHSTVTYNDSISKQTIIAAINRIDLKQGAFGFQKKGTVLTTANNWNVTAKNFMLDADSLAYKVGNKPEIKNVFDANNLKYNFLTLESTDLFFSGDTTKVSIKKLKATDRNNFSITKFETDFSMDQHSINAKNLKAETANSSIIADLNIQYSSLKSLKDSLPFLVLNLDLEDVRIKNSDVLYFNPQLIRQAFFQTGTNITTMSGVINGQLNRLKGKNIVIKTGNRTVIKTDFSITGLPDMETAYFIFPNLKIISGKRDIVMMAGPSIPETIGLPENIMMQVVFKGRFKSFESTISMGSSFGSANLFATIDQHQNFRSTVSMNNFNLGSLLKDTAMFGPVTITAEAQGHGLDKNTINAKIHAEASQFRLNKYTYHNLTIDGNFSGQGFEGRINLIDKNAEFEFDGLVNFNPDKEHYKFRLNLKGADLQKLNLTKDDIRIGFVAAADLKGVAESKLKGNSEISNLVIAQGDKIYRVDSFLFASINETGQSELNFNNFLIGLTYAGTISPADFSSEIKNFINIYFPFSDGIQAARKSEPSNFNFEMHLRNHPIFSKVLLPQLKEFEPGIIRGSFDSGKNELILHATIKKIIYGSTEIHDFLFDANSTSTALNYNISGSSISNTQVKLDNFLLEGKLADQTIFANLSSVDDHLNKKLVIRSQITRADGNYRLILDPKEFYLMNKRWDIAADNYIAFGKEGFLIHHFFINNTESQINIASVHAQFNDDLNISVSNFKLDDISRIIEKDTSLVKGNVDGNVLLKRVNNTYGIIADAKITSLVVRDVPIGNLSVKAGNPTPGRYDIELNLTGTDNNLTAKGYYMPEGGDHAISIQTEIQSLSLKTVEAFSMGQITEASGMLTGNLFIRGAANIPDITGELVFNNAFINPAFLNNRLELKHETIQFTKDEIYFKSFTLADGDKHTAIIDGTVHMKQFTDFIFDLHVTMKDFLLFNTTAKENKEFFGRMVIDSKIDVTGPMKLPVVIAKIRMKKGSNFTFAVPEEKLTTDKGEDVVEFIDSLKPNSILYKEEKKVKYKSRFTGFDLSSVIEIDKHATLRLLMDPASEDSLVVRGEAALSLTMDRSGKISLTGIYNLDEGSYLVSFQSVIKRKFDINPGSTIIWNGDPLDAEISINATYSVRASPIDLVANQVSGISEVDKSAYKQTYPFWILLKLRGEILHPEISFEIQLPPKNKGIIGGAVNAKLNLLNENPSELNKQVFALLVLGRFIQENPLQTDANGGVSNVFRSTVGNFLSTQLNKLSSNFVPGVELNFDIQSYDDYSTGQAQGRTQVGIGLKKQLFNERLTVQIGGAVDVEGTKATQNSASDITSDVTIEYKLSKDGRYRLKGFRNNLYEGAIEGQIIETGIGVSYVRDFNKWRELFRTPVKTKVNLQEKPGE
ncbi:MAG: translocation/assembly module TamB domain-containing protein [Bacteroidales bacterium]|nr:translocation/assembly module TamB domain-containing protein [Bacteroidales bacterium]